MRRKGLLETDAAFSGLSSSVAPDLGVEVISSRITKRFDKGGEICEMALHKVECDSFDSLAVETGMMFVDRAGTLGCSSH